MRVLSPFSSVAYVLTVARLLTEPIGSSRWAFTESRGSSSECRVIREHNDISPGLPVDILNDEGQFKGLFVKEE